MPWSLSFSVSSLAVYPRETMLTDQEFDTVVQEALDSLPAQFAELMSNVLVTVQPYADEEWLEGAPREEVFGLYLGVPLTERSFDDPYQLPDQIYLFQAALEEAFPQREALCEEIRVTVIHEVGHFFGLDEEEIEEALEIPHAQRVKDVEFLYPRDPS